jgi:hypothetical protein
MTVAFKFIRCAVTVLFASMLAAAHAQTHPSPSQPALPPQAKQTIEAVAGHWVGHMVAALPGSKPEPFPWEMTCKAVSLGSGAACSMKGTASIGLIEETCLIAYDPEGKAVHFMCVTSMREVH